MILSAYTDGASRGNPGHAGIGFLFKKFDGTILHSENRYIGKTTNNIAEYTALKECLLWIIGKINDDASFRCQEIVLHADSELMVRQMNRVYKVKDHDLKKHFTTIQGLLAKAPFRLKCVHIPREENSEADELANAAIDHHLSSAGNRMVV